MVNEKKRITLSDADKKVLDEIHQILDEHMVHKRFFLLMASYEDEDEQPFENEETNHTFLAFNMTPPEFVFLMNKSLAIVDGKLKSDFQKRTDQ